MFEAIPSELRSLRQWCLWKLVYNNEKPTKVPYQVNGEHANVTSSVTWNSFDAVLARLLLDDHYSGIGFIFTEHDPYSGVDLDATENEEFIKRHKLIYEILDSYSEISPSGKGMHIIVKGKVTTAVRRDKVEIYSSGRYFTMTGNVVENHTTINERNELLNQLYSEIKKSKQENAHNVSNEPAKYTDQEIIEQCRNATNGEKFSKLFMGQWRDYSEYPSQSEADFALVDIIAFYTQHREQISRIFLSSNLGKRDKAKRDNYLLPMIARAFDRNVTLVDVSGFKEAIEAKAGSPSGKALDFDSNITGSNPVPAATPDIPPGLMGDIAKFIYAAAPRPVPEIALAAAIGLMAGICGRAYNISGSGLNQYLLLLAPTGIGKEAISSGVDKLMASIFVGNPASKDFIGPSDMASGQALVRYLDDSLTKCFMCMMDEFGIRLQRMSDPRANDAQHKLKQTFLELYQRTGKGQVFRPTIFADRKNNTTSSPCPNVTILGYSAPERLYDNLTEEMIVDGVLPRFSIIEYKGLRPPQNYDHHTVIPSVELVDKLKSLTIHSLSQMSNANNGQQWITVQTDEASEKMHREFNTYCDNIYNSNVNSMYKALWSRAHLKALKLAALIAIGCDIYFPTVKVQHLEYAIKMVCNDIRMLLDKFETGNVGKNNEEYEQYNLLKKCIVEYVTSDWNKIKPYASDAKKMHGDKIITAQYLASRVSRLAPFKNDKLGSTRALERTIKNAIDHGFLINFNGQQKYNTTRRLFAVTPEILG